MNRKKSVSEERRNKMNSQAFNPTLLYADVNQKKLPEVFAPSDIQLMLDTIDNSIDYLKTVWGEWMRARDKVILMTIYLLALRPKEACSLRFDDFDTTTMTIKIHGRNNKTGKDRVIPIPPQLLHYLKEFSGFSRERFWKGSPYLFPSAENNHISSERWKHIFREKVLKPAGLWKPAINSTHPPYRSYTLRHTRATEVLNKTKDIFVVANLLGHAKLDSTKIYLHKNKEYQEYMREALSN